MTDQPVVCALIPARGGSKGIRGKNIRSFHGKPLLAHSIEAARLAPSVGRIIVSTDDPEIGSVAERYGAEFLRRPAELSDDTASSESALLHALDSLREAEGFEPDLVVFLQATSPLRKSGDVQNAIDLLMAEDADSLLSANRTPGFAWRVTKDAVTPVNYDPEKRPRRQEMTEYLVNENGSIYLFKPRVLREKNSRLGGKIAVYLMDALDSFEIDEPADWDLLEKLATLDDHAGAQDESTR